MLVLEYKTSTIATNDGGYIRFSNVICATSRIVLYSMTSEKNSKGSLVLLSNNYKDWRCTP